MRPAEPFFDECKLYTYDEYWQELFANCARNKFPRGLSYHSGRRTVYVRRPGASAAEPVPLPDDAAGAFQTMMGVFRDKLGMQSPADQQRAKRAIVADHGPTAVEHDEWKTVPRYLRDDFLSQYVAQLAKAKGLTLGQTRALLAYIEVNLQTKRIQPADIVLDGGGIVEIAELAYDAGRGTFRLAGKPERAEPMPPAIGADGGAKPQPAATAAADRGRFLRLVDEYVKSLNAKPPPAAPPSQRTRPGEREEG